MPLAPTRRIGTEAIPTQTRAAAVHASLPSSPRAPPTAIALAPPSLPLPRSLMMHSLLSLSLLLLLALSLLPLTRSALMFEPWTP